MMSLESGLSQGSLPSQNRILSDIGILQRMRGPFTAAMISALAVSGCASEGKQTVEVGKDRSVGVCSAVTGVFNQTEAACIYQQLSPAAIRQDMRRIYLSALMEKATTFDQIRQIPQVVNELVDAEMAHVPAEGMTTIAALQLIVRDSIAKQAALDTLNVAGWTLGGVLIAKALPGVSIKSQDNDPVAVNVDGVSSSKATAEGGKGGGGGGGDATVKIHQKIVPVAPHKGYGGNY